MLFTDQVAAREFVIQPYTRNGPSTPIGGVDPSATSANTTLFLYGKGTPDYGERIQENLIYMLEHFFGPTEPSFPIPGQVWCNSSVIPAQLSVYNSAKYTVASSSGNMIAIQSTGGLDSLAEVLARFNSMWTPTSRAFTFYSPTFDPITVVQSAVPYISGSFVYLTVTPTPVPVTLAGYTTGGWEKIFQSNVVNTLRTSFDANGQYIQNVPTPVLSGDAANKDYVDTAITGGTLVLSDLGDVLFATPGSPQTNAVLYFNGTKWTDKLVTSLGFLSLTGGTMTGALILNADPVVSLGAVTKQYVDNQPLSSLTVQITAPANNNLLVYDSGIFKWTNKTALSAGILPLSGGTLTGALSMGGNALVNLPTPVASTDAANKAYVDSLVASGGTVTSMSYDNFTGILTLNQTSSPPTINVTGFLPTPNNQLQSSYVEYTPPDPASVYPQTNMLFQSALATREFNTPGNTQDPVNIQVSAALGSLDQMFGNFTVPRHRLVMPGDGVNTAFNINTGAPNTGLIVGGAPQKHYIVGTSNLSVFVNGIKQIASDRGFFKLNGINTTTTYTGVTFNAGLFTLVIPSVNVTAVFHQGTHFSVSGTSTTNDGSYVAASSTMVGPDTVVTATVDAFATTPGTLPFVASGTGSVTYGPFGVMPSMQTGYDYGGSPNVVDIQVSVNGMTSTTLSLDTSTTNCNSFGQLAAAVNTMTSNYYINAIVGSSVGPLGNFVVSGDRTTQFVTGTNFSVRYSTGNDGTYTVQAPGAAYNPGLNQTTIPITSSVPTASTDGIVFQDNWGYTMSVENGTIVLYSNVVGASSSISIVSSTLLTNVTGVDWPLTIPVLTGTTNTFAPQDWAYQEIGLQGYPSSLVVFTAPPAGPGLGADIVEFVAEHETYFNSYNPTANAVTVG